MIGRRAFLFVRQFNSNLPGQNGRHFQMQFSWMKSFFILILISLKFVPKFPSDNKIALVQVIAWRRAGDMALPEPMSNRFTDAYMRH